MGLLERLIGKGSDNVSLTENGMKYLENGEYCLKTRILEYISHNSGTGVKINSAVIADDLNIQQSKVKSLMVSLKKEGLIRL